MDRSSIPRIAPLKIYKNRSRSGTSTTVSSATVSLQDSSRAESRAEQFTPPQTPSASTEDLTLLPSSLEPQFHTYLRAFYPFHPACDDLTSTVTLPLNQGDLVLVHSIHVNGWADGTLLASGTRGWLPTNYCEAYHPQQMQRLMNALTTFYDVVKGCNEGASLTPLYNQDYMRGLIAGVRYLYVSADGRSPGEFVTDCHFRRLLTAWNAIRPYSLLRLETREFGAVANPCYRSCPFW